MFQVYKNGENGHFSDPGDRKSGLENLIARTPGPPDSGVTTPDVQHVRSFVRSCDVQQLCLLVLCLDPAEDRFLLGLGFDGHPGKCVLGGGGGGDDRVEYNLQPTSGGSRSRRAGRWTFGRAVVTTRV